MSSPGIAGGRVTLLAGSRDVRPGARKAVDDIEQPDETSPSPPLRCAARCCAVLHAAVPEASPSYVDCRPGSLCLPACLQKAS